MDWFNFGAYRLSKLWTQEGQSEQITPSLFLTFTASILVNALAAGLLGYTNYGFMLLDIGSISWLIMDWSCCIYWDINFKTF